VEVEELAVPHLPLPCNRIFLPFWGGMMLISEGEIEVESDRQDGYRSEMDGALP
jgi:hypothetical protein